MYNSSSESSFDNYITAVAGTGVLLGKLPIEELASIEKEKTYVVVRIGTPAAIRIIGFECIPGDDALCVKSAIEALDVPRETTRVISVLSGQLFSAKLKSYSQGDSVSASGVSRAA